MKNIFLSVLCLFGISSGCSAADDSLLSPEAFAKAVSADSTAFVLDVRRADEFAEGHIAGAHLLNVLDKAAFDEGLKKLDRQRTYYIYCRSGRRSHVAWQRLVDVGLKAYDLKGGILNWIGHNLPTVKD